MHQEQIESENGLVFFIALHNIKKSEGGLMFVKKDLNYTIPHFRNETKNGLGMFIYQASESFKIWHGFAPEVDEKIYTMLHK